MTPAENARLQSRTWDVLQTERWETVRRSTRRLRTVAESLSTDVADLRHDVGPMSRRSARAQGRARFPTARELATAAARQETWEARKLGWLHLAWALERANARLIQRPRYCPDGRCRRAGNCVGPHCVGDATVPRRRTRRRLGHLDPQASVIL